MLRILINGIKSNTVFGGCLRSLSACKITNISAYQRALYTSQLPSLPATSFTKTFSLIRSFVPPTCNGIIQQQIRTLTKFSLQKGKRKSVKAVLRRFYRLNWGGWIRTRAGRKKHLWTKSPKQKYRYRQHVLVNATQSWLLDSMVTSYWRRPKYYVDDPYGPYHTREEFMYTRKKPLIP